MTDGHAREASSNQPLWDDSRPPVRKMGAPRLRARELVDMCLGDVFTVGDRLRDVGVGDDGDR